MDAVLATRVGWLDFVHTCPAHELPALTLPGGQNLLHVAARHNQVSALTWLVEHASTVPRDECLSIRSCLWFISNELYLNFSSGVDINATDYESGWTV